ncbi:hypothetical protein [Streptomyces sp. V1I1]|uniref:hypothetical protein n=1 Tax=Streptomyces sp. V1I1 TaxID=3042272 RepID=UPI002782240D|nr:hypothetical protein [Streptomyces sp. V1I1]MDQ0938451.1 hypothetical protein [Streptomyces sp. V1I1]
MRAARRKTGLIVAGAAALAVLAGGVYTMTYPEADTRGYMLDPPRSVGEYVVLGNDLSYVGIVDCAGEPSDADCFQGETEVKGTGITPRDAGRIVRNASGTGADYAVGGWRPNGTTGRRDDGTTGRRKASG